LNPLENFPALVAGQTLQALDSLPNSNSDLVTSSTKKLLVAVKNGTQTLCSTCVVERDSAGFGNVLKQSLLNVQWQA